MTVLSLLDMWFSLSKYFNSYGKERFISKRPSHPRKQHPPQHHSASPTSLQGLIPQGPCPPLTYWKENNNNRHDFKIHILPWLSAGVRKKLLLHHILERTPWISEFIRIDLRGGVGLDEETQQFRESTAAFWNSPEDVIDELRDFARSWFIILLRHYYRRRYWYGRKTLVPDPEMRDLRHNDFIARLEAEQLDELIGRRSKGKYGTTFYRDSHSITQHCDSWTGFCKALALFCQELRVQAVTNDPEDVLRALRRDFTRTTRFRTKHEIRNVAHHSLENAHYVRTLEVVVQKIKEQIVSSAGYSELRIHELERQQAETTQQLNKAETKNFERASRTDEALGRLEQKMDQLKEQMASTISRNDRLEVDFHNVRSQLNSFESLIVSLATKNHMLETLAAIVTCRSLMEALLPDYAKNGNPQHDKKNTQRWKEFFPNQWKFCLDHKPEGHPLLKLVDGKEAASLKDIGIELYGTLSIPIHKWVDRCHEKVDDDLKTLIFAILPQDWLDRVDKTIERRRWNTDPEQYD